MSSMTESSGSSGSHGLVGFLGTLLWRGGTLLAVGLGTIVALLYFKQESMLYFPEIGGIPRRPRDNPRRYRSPAEHSIPFESHHIECEDGVNIHAWLLFRSENANKVPTLIFFHGNAGNIGLRLPNAIQMMRHLNVNIMMCEYRGYGESDSVKPNEAGLRLDAEAALRFISKHPQIDNSKLFLFGRSLGGAVSFHLAQYAEKMGLPLAGVIVENTFLSISSMVDALLPYVAPFKPLVLRMDWNSERIVPRLQLPVLYLAGGRDELVPHSHMMTLYRTTKRSRLVRMHVVEEGTHNETWLQGGQEYWDAILQFLTQTLETTGECLPQSAPTKSSSQCEAAAEIGIEVTAGNNVNGSSNENSIPLMPSKLMSMAQEAVRGASSTSGKSGVDPNKKDE
jgi:abhydrolase domain-containing protein 13